jgi:hypothetical protein
MARPGAIRGSIKARVTPQGLGTTCTLVLNLGTLCTIDTHSTCS